VVSFGSLVSMKLLKMIKLHCYQHAQNVDSHIMKSEELHGWPTPQKRIMELKSDMERRQNKIDNLVGEIYGEIS